LLAMAIFLAVANKSSLALDNVLFQSREA
jgi:hypothetical protein